MHAMVIWTWQERAREVLITAFSRLIEKMDNGKSAVFARRLGMGKSTVHHWIKGNGTPTLQASLTIAGHCGISLLNLLTGNLSNWRPPRPEQMVLTLPIVVSRPRAAPRTLDWTEIEKQLEGFLKQPTTICVPEAARRLDIEARPLYLRATLTTRQLGEQWKAYLSRRQKEAVTRAWPYLETACLEIWREGKSVTRREIAERVPVEVLSPVANLLNVLKDVQMHLRSSAARHISSD